MDPVKKSATFAALCAVWILSGATAGQEMPESVDARVAHEWFLPFPTRNRTSWNTVRLISPFGAGRSSFVRGHLHSGADLVPRKRREGVKVLAAANGEVCSIHLTAPHTTVVLQHVLPDGALVFTSYKHLAEVHVKPGQQVSPDTILGRLFTRKEARSLGGPYDHLHLEVRKSFDDEGSASWTTMTRDELNLRFFDPLPFFKKRIPRPKSLPPDKTRRLLLAARQLLGVSYHFGGRLRRPGDGIDCQGLLFYAAERIGRCGWKSFSTMPTDSVAWGELGEPVPGLDPVRSESLDTGRMLPGDIIFLLAPAENPAEPALTTINGQPAWVWHTGMYAGDGQVLHADFFTGRVVEENLNDFLSRFGYSGIFVTRMSRGPQPKRCRHHRRMILPVE